MASVPQTFLLVACFVLASSSLGVTDFPKCFDDLDCVEGDCCVSDIPGVEGSCLPCGTSIRAKSAAAENIPLKSTKTDNSKKPIPKLIQKLLRQDRCGHAGMESCSPGHQEKHPDTRFCDFLNPCPPGECCFGAEGPVGGECAICGSIKQYCDFLNPCPAGQCCLGEGGPLGGECGFCQTK